MPKNTTVLVIDDDPLLISIVEHKLNARGFRVIKASDGESGLREAENAIPDAIVLDLMMPTMDGRHVLRRLLANPALSKIPVIMLTSRRGESDIVEAFEHGAADYLSKPFSPDELVARIDRLIGSRRAARS